jgi:hypothetical protein
MPLYKPFAVMDIREGVRTDLEPWKLPGDAWQTLNDCSLRKGVLFKRFGKTLFGQVVATNTATQVPTLQTNPVMGIYNFLDGATENLVVFDQNRMNTTVTTPVTGVSIDGAFADGGGGQVVVNATGHGFSDDDVITISGTTNYNDTYRVQNKNANDFEITETFNAEGAGGTIKQERFEDASKSQIRYVGKAGQNYTPAVDDVVKGEDSTAIGTVEKLIVDTGTIAGDDARGTIIFKRGTITGTFQDNEELQENGTPANIAGQSQGAASDGAFTGDNTNFFWVANWELGGSSRMYITNNNDPLQKYDGVVLSRLTIDIGDDDDVNDVNSALLIFIVKERIVIFSVNEDGTDFLQRARWSAIKEPQSWPTANFVDAPTEDTIKGGKFIGDDLYIWMRKSVWRFAYTGDVTTPFEWERVDDFEGAEAQMSIAVKDNLQYAVGKSRLQIMDGRRVLPADLKIPDITQDWVQNSVLFSNALVVEEERQIITSYAASGAPAHVDGNIYPNKLLIRNYEDQGFSNHTHDVHTMGKSEIGSDVTWEQDLSWTDIDDPWNAGSNEAGFPTTLIGDHDGLVLQLNTSGSDNGSDISFSAKGARLNPFIKDGKDAWLEKIDFFVTVDASASFDVDSFINTSSTPYQTKTITATAKKGASSKAWHTVFMNALGNEHSIEIGNDASNNRPIIHAMIWWFKPGAKGRFN